MAKNKTQKKPKTPDVAGYRLCVWCKGGLDENNQPINTPWHLVYAPYWLSGYEQKPAAPGWNKAPVVYAVVNTIFDYSTAENARHILETLPPEELVKDADAFHKSQMEHFIAI